MRLIKLVGYSFIVVALTAPAVRADDPCLGDEEKKAALAQSAALQQAEQAGQPAALFAAYMRVAASDCIDRYDKNAAGKAKANMPKLGRDLAKSAEAKGALYSGEPVRADGQTSAFRYLETIGDHQEANRVLLKAVQAKPDDLRFLRRPGTSITIDTVRSTPIPARELLCFPARVPARVTKGGDSQRRPIDEG